MVISESIGMDEVDDASHQHTFESNLPATIDPAGLIKGGKKIDDDDVQVITFSGGGGEFGASGASGETADDGSDDTTDIISDYIGHYGWWQFFWTFLLGLFQCPSTFHIFAFVFQVSFLSGFFFFFRKM